MSTGSAATSCFTRSGVRSTWAPDEISAFLGSLAVQRRVSASTQNQALSALLFLYRDVLRVEVGTIERLPRARMPTRVPVVLSRDEVSKVMQRLSNHDRTVLDGLCDGRVFTGFRLQASIVKACA